MKVWQQVALFLSQHTKHVFAVNGGACLWLIKGIDEQEGLTGIYPQHEQAASFQADAYARLRGFGVAIATSGPGASNLITGIATSFYDSVPCLYITGNQSRSRMRGDTGCRQIGFQETPIVEIVNPITKYSKTIMASREVIPELERAVSIAKTHRQGPVLIDIPDDLQREDV